MVKARDARGNIEAVYSLQCLGGIRGRSQFLKPVYYLAQSDPQFFDPLDDSGTLGCLFSNFLIFTVVVSLSRTIINWFQINLSVIVLRCSHFSRTESL